MFLFAYTLRAFRLMFHIITSNRWCYMFYPSNAPLLVHLNSDISFVWDVTSCSLVYIYHCFGEDITLQEKWRLPCSRSKPVAGYQTASSGTKYIPNKLTQLYGSGFMMEMSLSKFFRDNDYPD